MLKPMAPGEFCLWLRTVLQEQGARPLTAMQVRLIREALSGVFRHDIDPRMGDAAHQAMLDKVHFPQRRG